MSKNKAQIFEHAKQTYGADGDFSVFKPIFNVYCQKRILAVMEDAQREALIDEILDVWLKALNVIAVSNTENMPKMRDFLTNFFIEHEEYGWKKMAQDFKKYVNEEQFELYSRCTPYEKMTKETLDLSTRVHCGQVKAITDIDEIADVMVEKLGTYFQKALDLFEMGTNVSMRMTCIVEHSENLDFHLGEEYAKYKEIHNLTDEDMTKNEENLEILDKIHELEKNQEFLKDVSRLIQEADLASKSW